MFASREKRLRRWAKTRFRGVRRFILVNGVIGWGMTSGALFSVLMWFFNPGFNATAGLCVALILFTPLGVIWGWIFWHAMERQFNASVERLA
jgi:hypothetical protein